MIFSAMASTAESILKHFFSLQAMEFTCPLFRVNPPVTATILFAFSLAQKFSFQNLKESPSGGSGDINSLRHQNNDSHPCFRIIWIATALGVVGGFYSCFNFLAEIH